MIFRPIIFYSEQTNCPSFLYYLKYHYTYDKIKKNILCAGKNKCELCVKNINLYEKFLIPVFYIKGTYINVKVLYKNYSFSKELFDFISKNYEFYKDNDLMKPSIMFIKDFEMYPIDPVSFKVSKNTIDKVNQWIENFKENYIDIYFTNNKIFIEDYLKKLKYEENKT